VPRGSQCTKRERQREGEEEGGKTGREGRAVGRKERMRDSHVKKSRRARGEKG
jgi:hypothetical protein